MPSGRVDRPDEVDGGGAVCEVEGEAKPAFLVEPPAGAEGEIVLDRTVFYAESGGQVGDRGILRAAGGIFAVEDTQKIQASVFGHHGTVTTGKIAVGNGVTAKVDIAARNRTMRNHSATHLMHKALREVLELEGRLAPADRRGGVRAQAKPLPPSHTPTTSEGV